MNTGIIHLLYEKSKIDPKRIVFPEGEEPNILQAARWMVDHGIGIPIVLGDTDRIEIIARDSNIALDGIIVLSYDNPRIIERMAKEHIAQSDLFSEEAAKRHLRKPINFAAMMVNRGDADALVAGLTYTTDEVIIACRIFIGMSDGIEIPSSMFLMEIPGFAGEEGESIVFADCGVTPNPNAEELSDIVITTSQTVKTLLGWKPRVAMLSFSTKGSASHTDVDKVLKALSLVRERDPGLFIDGEFQLDAAIVPDVAKKKVSEGSHVAGRANILIFPDLTSGNIAYKAVQRFANARAYGPFLQGFRKTASDLSRGSDVEDIIGVIIMAVVQSQSQ